MRPAHAKLRGAPHGAAVRTLPEQIADDLGAAIARGDFAGGERLVELDIASRYGVSRGPIREALRLLALRGLAELYPRRGAFVIEVSLDSLVDLFNVRAVLMGLATRYFAIMAADEVRDRLKEALAELERVGKAVDTDPLDFTHVTSRISALISRNCGSESLSHLIEHQNESSAWRSLWQSGRLDFQTPERRREATADYLRMGDAIERKDGSAAEAGMRHLIMRARESAVAALARIRGEAYDVRRLISA